MNLGFKTFALHSSTIHYFFDTKSVPQLKSPLTLKDPVKIFRVQMCLVYTKIVIYIHSKHSQIHIVDVLARATYACPCAILEEKSEQVHVGFFEMCTS